MNPPSRHFLNLPVLIYIFPPNLMNGMTVWIELEDNELSPNFGNDFCVEIYETEQLTYCLSTAYCVDSSWYRWHLDIVNRVFKLHKILICKLCSRWLFDYYILFGRDLDIVICPLNPYFNICLLLSPKSAGSQGLH